MTQTSHLFEYFTRFGIPEQKPFDLYKKGGEPVVAVTYLDDRATQNTITCADYDDAVKRFARLSQRTQDVYVDNLRREPKKLYAGLTADQQKAYQQDLQTAGLDAGDKHREIIRDHKLLNGKGRRMNVYSVNGHPVFAESMSPQTISFYMGTQNLSESDRLEKSYADGPDRAAKYIERTHGVEPEVAQAAVKNPAAQKLLARMVRSPAT